MNLALWRYEISKGKSDLRKTVAGGFLILNFSILIISDSVVFKEINNDNYYWTEEKLTVNHFKGSVEKNMEKTAVVFPSMVGKISRVFNYPKAIILTADRNNESWIKKELFSDNRKDQATLKNLLNHEKGHLDLTEIYRRKAMDSINNLNFPTYDRKFEIVGYFFKVSDSINDVFDNETGYGTINEQAIKWGNYIDFKLNSQ